MKYIKKQSRYSNTELIEIEYGLTGIYLTISKLIILSILAIWLGIIKEMFIFMIFFNIIRTTAFGLHANKSWQCLLSSIIIFIGIPLGCKYISIETTMKMIVGLISIIFICKNAPADTKKRPIINKKRRFKFIR